MSQQMPTVYPVSDTVPTSNHSSNGSYGTVFIVLAIIIILSTLACFLGRLFNKRQDVAKPSNHIRQTKEKHATRSEKDGDIEFGHDKRFATAKVAATSEPTDPFGEPKMGRPNSSHDQRTMGRPNSFQEPNMMGPGANSFHQPTMGRPNSFQEPNRMGHGPSSFHEPTMGRPNSFQEPDRMGPEPNSFHEPTMGRPNSFDKGGSQGEHQMRFDASRDNKLNFIPRARPQRY